MYNLKHVFQMSRAKDASPGLMHVRREGELCHCWSISSRGGQQETAISPTSRKGDSRSCRQLLQRSLSV